MAGSTSWPTGLRGRNGSANEFHADFSAWNSSQAPVHPRQACLCPQPGPCRRQPSLAGCRRQSAGNDRVIVGHDLLAAAGHDWLGHPGPWLPPVMNGRLPRVITGRGGSLPVTVLRLEWPTGHESCPCAAGHHWRQPVVPIMAHDGAVMSRCRSHES